MFSWFWSAVGWRNALIVFIANIIIGLVYFNFFFTQEDRDNSFHQEKVPVIKTTFD